MVLHLQFFVGLVQVFAVLRFFLTVVRVFQSYFAFPLTLLLSSSLSASICADLRLQFSAFRQVAMLRFSTERLLPVEEQLPQ